MPEPSAPSPTVGMADHAPMFAEDADAALQQAPASNQEATASNLTAAAPDTTASTPVPELVSEPATPPPGQGSRDMHDV